MIPEPLIRVCSTPNEFNKSIKRLRLHAVVVGGTFDTFLIDTSSGFRGKGAMMIELESIEHDYIRSLKSQSYK